VSVSFRRSAKVEYEVSTNAMSARAKSPLVRRRLALGPPDSPERQRVVETRHKIEWSK